MRCRIKTRNYFHKQDLYLGATLSQGRNWRGQDWSWNSTLASIPVIDTTTASADGNYLVLLFFMITLSC